STAGRSSNPCAVKPPMRRWPSCWPAASCRKTWAISCSAHCRAPDSLRTAQRQRMPPQRVDSHGRPDSRRHLRGFPMKRRLTTLLLAVSSMLILGGCVSQPYRYSATADGGGYYSGQSAYGNADTVVYGEAYGAPWGWGPGWGYAPGWGSVGFGVAYTSRPRHQG